MKPRNYFFILMICSLVSCARVPAKAVLKADTSGVNFKAQVTGRNCALKGAIVIEPFKSGEDVPASSEVEQASLMLVKGCTEGMLEGSPSLKIITDKDTSRAKFFIKGYITKYKKSEGLIDYVKKEPNVLAVEGKVISLEDDRVIVDFSSSIQSVEQSDFSDFAYKIGQRLAVYLREPDKESL